MVETTLSFFASKRRWLVESGQWIRKHAVLSAFCYALFFLLFVLIAGHVTWEGADDFTVSMLLSGSFGTSSALNPISSYFLNVLLIKLYEWIPSVNWFGISEVMSVLLSFWVLNYILIKNADNRGLRFAAVLTPVFEMEFLYKLQFTRIATLLPFAGTLLLYDTFFRQKDSAEKTKADVRCVIKKVLLSVAVAGMLVFGSWFRFSCLYLGIFFGMVFVFSDLLVDLIKTHDKAHVIAVVKKCTVCACVILSSFLLCVAFKMKNDAICANNQEYMAYKEYNLERANVCDYLPSDFSKLSVVDDYISENDFIMMKNCNFYDAYFSLDFWRGSNDKLFLQNTEALTKSFLDVHALFRYNQGKFKGHRSLLLLCLFFMFIALFGIHKKNCIHYIFVVLATFAVSLYFAGSGRYPPWVADTVYFMCCAVLLLSLAKYPLKSGMNYAALKSSAAVVMLLFCMFYGFRRADAHFLIYSQNESLRSMIEYAENDKENIYLIDSCNNIPYPIIDLYGPFKSIPRGNWSNILRVGNWDVNHPVKNRQLKALGIDSPVSSLLQDNVYLICTLGEKSDEFKTLSEDFSDISLSLNEISDKFAVLSANINKKSENQEELSDKDETGDNDTDILSADFDSLSEEFSNLSSRFVLVSKLFNNIPYELYDDIPENVKKYETFFQEHHGVNKTKYDVVLKSDKWCIINLYAVADDENASANKRVAD